mmetsp:Transcript_9809/g.29232  ORF Transcript_9809/g.29232 Transcript_9809/m.29232 type:complete len:293 (+) Transcript_9809:104-982(+)
MCPTLCALRYIPAGAFSRHAADACARAARASTVILRISSSGTSSGGRRLSLRGCLIGGVSGRCCSSAESPSRERFPRRRTRRRRPLPPPPLRTKKSSTSHSRHWCRCLGLFLYQKKTRPVLRARSRASSASRASSSSASAVAAAQAGLDEDADACFSPSGRMRRSYTLPKSNAGDGEPSSPQADPMARSSLATRRSSGLRVQHFWRSSHADCIPASRNLRRRRRWARIIPWAATHPSEGGSERTARTKAGGRRPMGRSAEERETGAPPVAMSWTRGEDGRDGQEWDSSARTV